MNELKFSELGLIPEMQRAIDELGFEQTTDIQANAIPLIRKGADVIGKSQTGTGKTLAFAIPAIEKIDREEANPTPQVLILCPTRELAQQGCEEIKKLTRFMRDIWPVDVYGGAAMDRQIMRLRRANLVIGTPGRIMDHMRRGTLSLEHIRLVVLDEADEMLSMGFIEDIQTILTDVPEEHQTVLFSATMPDAILALTEQFLKEPERVEINREQVTLEKIKQLSMEVPMGRKLDALILLLHAYDPKRCMIFCNTKLMVDEVSAHLNRNGFTSEAIHGDMNQSQRTRVMEGFKASRLPILVATDVAARGIDVSDVDYVINYDIPQNSEYYIHRIGRTGRAGKEGCAISLISGRRQFFQLRDTARAAKSDITPIPIPTVAEIRNRMDEKNLARIQDAILSGVSERNQKLIASLVEKGYDLDMVAAAAFDLCFARDDSGLKDILLERKSNANGRYRRAMINIGRIQKVAPNHIVSAVAEKGRIRGSLIGKIEIYDDHAIVGLPADIAEEIVADLKGLTICGVPTETVLLPDKPEPRPQRADFVHKGPYGKPAYPDRRNRNAEFAERKPYGNRGSDFSDRREYGNRNAEGKPYGNRRPEEFAERKPYGNRRPEEFAERRTENAPQKRGKQKLSPEAKARILDSEHLNRFEIGARKGDRNRPNRNFDRRPNRKTNQKKHHG